MKFKSHFSLIFIFSFFFFYTGTSQDTLQSPKAFLGYELGENFTYHNKVVAYVEYVAQNSEQVVLENYGTTYERRPLVAAIISSQANIKSLEAIRNSNLSLAGFLNRSPSTNTKPIIWLSYNIHGDEAAGTEAALKTIYHLLTDAKAQKWLEEVIIIIDPCENPDGRDRYTNWYNQVVNYTPNPNENSLEHHQSWPGGRFNHYLFDLNRDWAWQTQMESKARVKIYQKWMPQVYVDLHEMGVNSPYFFAPAAAPFHEAITDWQRDFQHLVGKNNAKTFDKDGWLYYTDEVFDLLYPSYGDTWPTFNGAIGFTYEQGGSGAAGLLAYQETGNILSLKDRLEHHFASSLSTIEAAFDNREKLMTAFGTYFSKRPKEKYNAYVIKYTKEKKQTIVSLLDLLDKQKIQYGHPKSSSSSVGFDFLKNKNSSFQYDKKDIVIRLDQPLSRFVKVLFEPKTMVEDSLTYDLTAWALPYVYELEAFAVETDIPSNQYEQASDFLDNQLPDTAPYAILMTYFDGKDVAVLSELLQNNLVVRFAERPFKINGKAYERGTLIITKGENKSRYLRYDKEVINIANKFEKSVDIVETGLVEMGKDFGSGSMKYIKPIKVALIGGDGVSPTAYGEVWHYLEQVIHYPVSTIHTEYLSKINLAAYDVIILPSGNYGKYSQMLLNFAKEGGKIIALEQGAVSLAANNQTAMELLKSHNMSFTPEEVRYENQERAEVAEMVAGSIYKLHLDDSHPLAFGYKESVHIMKRNSKVFSSLDGNGWNVGTFKKDSHISGFVGNQLKKELVNSTGLAVEHIEKGYIIYMSDSPIFRGFWHSGQVIFGNALFFVGQ